MTNITFPSKNQIIDCLNGHYGIDVVHLYSFSKGADINALVFKAMTQNEPAYFVKVKHGLSQDISLSVIAILQQAGIQNVLPLVQTLDGQTFRERNGWIFTVSPFIHGQNGFECDLTQEQWTEFGETMRKIHGVTVLSALQDKIRQEHFSPRWRQTLRKLLPLIRSNINEDEYAIKFRDMMKKHINLIKQLITRAEQLAQNVQKEATPYVLCHSDLHAGNVLIDEKGKFYIVDWDESVLAPKERDLMFIGGGIANTWNKPEHEKLFYDGYGKVHINIKLLAYYRFERIVEDIAQYAEMLLSKAGKTQDRAQWYNELEAQFEPEGVIQIALETDQHL